MEQPNKYKGKQAIIVSNRVVFVSRKDDVIINAKETIGLQSNKSIHLDTGKFVIVNSPEIYLGLNAVNKSQPVLRGNDFRDATLQLINGITQLIDACKKTPGEFPSTFMLGIGYLEGIIKTIKTRYGSDLSKTMSTKTYVE